MLEGRETETGGTLGGGAQHRLCRQDARGRGGLSFLLTEHSTRDRTCEASLKQQPLPLLASSIVNPRASGARPLETPGELLSVPVPSGYPGPAQSKPLGMELSHQISMCIGEGGPLSQNHLSSMLSLTIAPFLHECMHSFIQYMHSIFIKHLLCAKHYSRHWECPSE